MILLLIGALSWAGAAWSLPRAPDDPEAAAAMQADIEAGHRYARHGEYDAALARYRQALAADVVRLPALERRLRYTMAQLEFAAGRFQAAVAQMQAWQALEPEVESFGPYIFMGQAYFKVQEYPSAIRALEIGLGKAESAGVAIPEHWLALLHHLYVEERKWQQAEGVLERLTSLYPSPRYRQLLEEVRERS